MYIGLSGIFYASSKKENTPQGSMCTLESRVEPYAKKNRIYTEASEVSSNKIARYHIQSVYDTEAYLDKIENLEFETH